MAYDQIIADIIIDAMTAGQPLLRTCAEAGVSKSQVYTWRDEHPEFAERFAKARDDGFEALAEDCLNIADHNGLDTKFTERGESMDSEYVQRSKIRIDTRLRLLAAWNPSKYGTSTKLNVDATVRQASVTIPPEALSDTDASSFYAQFMKGDG